MAELIGKRNSVKIIQELERGELYLQNLQIIFYITFSYFLLYSLFYRKTSEEMGTGHRGMNGNYNNTGWKFGGGPFAVS